ncbi:MAG: PrgI family protein [Patescibacteria group bacterium]
MQQYQVPQFIDIEDKIIGPLTLKQFLYLLGGVGIAGIAYIIFIPILFIIVGLFALVFSTALAFYKVNGIPLPNVFRSAFLYFTKPRLYIWKQDETKKTAQQSLENTILPLKVPNTAESKLEDLAWSLDIKEKTRERR